MDGQTSRAWSANLASQGRFLAAHDRAMTAIADGAATDELRHLAVLTLARAGATSSAVRLLQQLGLTESSDPEISGLHPRLLKDMALQTHDRADAVAAGHAYEKLWRRYGSGWHGVNVAAMALLAGDRERALTSAAAVRQLRDEGDYWSAATQGEAALCRSAIPPCATLASARPGAWRTRLCGARRDAASTALRIRHPRCRAGAG